MIAKEQAYKLIYNYCELLNLKSTNELVLKCSLYAVEEILYTCSESMDEYWLEVKQVILNHEKHY